MVKAQLSTIATLMLLAICSHRLISSAQQVRSVSHAPPKLEQDAALLELSYEEPSPISLPKSYPPPEANGDKVPTSFYVRSLSSLCDDRKPSGHGPRRNASVVVQIAIPAKPVTSEFGQKEKARLRELVLSHRLLVVTNLRPDGFAVRRFNIPGEIHALYKEHPIFMLATLLEVVREGQPVASINAAAFGLCAGTDSYPIWTLLEPRKDYDKVDEDIGMTRRDYWAKVLSMRLDRVAQEERD